MPNLAIHTIPKVGLNGHLYITEVTLGDLADKNDIVILFGFDGNATGFSIEDITLTAEDSNDNDISDEVLFSVTRLSGKDGGAVYAASLRPPGSGGNGDFTITVPADVVEEGNPETSLTVTYSDDFPDSEWTELFSADDNGNLYDQIVSMDSEKIYFRHDDEIHVYDWDGNQDDDLTNTLLSEGVALRLNANAYLVRNALKLEVVIDGGKTWESASIIGTDPVANMQSLTLTKDGRLLVLHGPSGSHEIQLIPIEDIHIALLSQSDLSNKLYANISLLGGDLGDFPNNTWYLASDLNILYIEPRSTGDHYIQAYGTEYGVIVDRRIPMAASLIDYAPVSLFIFQNRLFRYNTNNALEYINLTDWQIPQALNKIYPQKVLPGDRIDLRKFIKSASDITFDLGYKIPDWLSIEDNRWLNVASDAPADATSYLRLIGINPIGASPFYGCMFYVQVKADVIPTWFNVEKLSMRDDQEINLFEYVRGADTIEAIDADDFPDFLELENGVLTSSGDETTAEVALRAGTSDSFFSDKAIEITIAPKFADTSILNVVDYLVKIEGIDVTEHLVRESFPSTNKSLDWIRLNEFKRGRLNVNFYSNADNNGLFNDTNPSSFWEENGLNKSGYLNTISVSAILENEDGTSQNILIFQGIIFDADDSLNAGQMSLNCYDSSYALKESQLQESIRGVTKIVELAPAESSQTPVSEGVYRAETTFGKIIPKRSQAWNDALSLTLKEIANLVDSVTENNTAFVTDTGVRTEGGYLHDDVETPLLVNTETPYRYLPVASAIEKYLKTENSTLTTQIQEVKAFGDAHIRANGNLSFATEAGRILKYPVDWIVDTENSKLYYLLSHPANFISDELVCRDLKTQTSHILYRFDPNVAALKLATSDFDTFTVMLIDTIGFDWSTEDATEIYRIIKEGYDASVSVKSQIVSYQQSQNIYETIVAKTIDYRPVAALHYWTGVNGQDYQWCGISEGDRGTFDYQDDNLIYRWAKGANFGIAQVASNGTVSALFTETKDDYFNHLNFAFDIAGSDTYFAFGSGDDRSSTLVIKKRSGNTITTIFSKTLDFFDLNDLDHTGNAWLGVQELLVDGNSFYFVVPVSRNGRDISTGAGVIIYKYSTVTQQLTVILKKDFVQHGICMLTKFENQIYFAESPAVTTEYTSKNRNVAYQRSEAKGFLYCISASDGKAETIGNIYFDSGVAYNSQLPMKGLVFDDDLNFIIGYGNQKRIHLNAAGSSPENYQWVSFGKDYRYKLPILKKEGSILGALTELSRTINSTLFIDKNIVSIEDRHPRGGVVATYVVTVSDTMIAYESANRAFPESGHLLIGEEVISYTGKTDTHFTGLTRGELATDPQEHTAGDLITFIDRLIEDREKIDSTEPYLQVTVSLDSTHLFNSISAGQQIFLKDEPSQKMFGESDLQLDLGTTVHEIPFATFISKQYLDRFKNLEHMINARVRAFFLMDPGEVVCFKFLRDTEDVDGYLTAMQIMSAQTSGNFTTLRGRQITPSITPSEEPDISQLRITDGSGATFFADGARSVLGWYGDERYIDIDPRFDVELLSDLEFTQYQQIEPIVFPEAKSPIGNPLGYSLSPTLGAGLIFNSRTRIISGASQSIQSATEYTYTATDLKTGETATLTRSIEVEA